MEKLKQYKYIILIMLLILGFAFYWYEWRPSQIRTRCLVDAELNPRIVIINDDATRHAQIELEYKNCVRIWGLEK